MSSNYQISKVKPVARILFGLIYLVFGVNFFFHFLPSSPPDSASKAGQFLGALFSSGYFFLVLKIIESLFGLLLVLNIFTPILLILIFPVTFNILLFHLILEPAVAGLVIGSLLFILNLYLIWTNWTLYAPLLTSGSAVKVPTESRV
jgi:putative oxidoreductase